LESERHTQEFDEAFLHVWQMIIGLGEEVLEDVQRKDSHDKISLSVAESGSVYDEVNDDELDSLLARQNSLSDISDNEEAEKLEDEEEEGDLDNPDDIEDILHERIPSSEDSSSLTASPIPKSLTKKIDSSELIPGGLLGFKLDLDGGIDELETHFAENGAEDDDSMTQRVHDCSVPKLTRNVTKTFATKSFNHLDSMALGESSPEDAETPRVRFECSKHPKILHEKAMAAKH